MSYFLFIILIFHFHFKFLLIIQILFNFTINNQKYHFSNFKFTQLIFPKIMKSSKSPFIHLINQFMFIYFLITCLVKNYLIKKFAFHLIFSHILVLNLPFLITFFHKFVLFHFSILKSSNNILNNKFIINFKLKFYKNIFTFSFYSNYSFSSIFYSKFLNNS